MTKHLLKTVQPYYGQVESGIKTFELSKQHTYAFVDAKACKSDNPDFMCQDCKCWKADRMKYLKNSE